MIRLRSFGARARQGLTLAANWARRRTEADRASAYWAGLTEYHLTNDDDPQAIERSRWIADTVVPGLGVTSLLEVGANSGRNLQYIHQSHPEMVLKGIDVNPLAVDFALSKALPIAYELADANIWNEPADGWDVVLTMSVLDHIPDGAAEILAQNIARSARHVIAVELWDGRPGRRGPFKYSRDTRALFEQQGLETLVWEKAPGQYDDRHSLLWAFVGERA